MWWTGVGLAMMASILVHAILARVSPGKNAVMLFLAGGLMVGLTLIAWAWYAFGGFTIEFVAAGAVYAAFCELYMFLFTLVLSSVSSNILVRLAAGPQALDDLDASYASAGMVEQRLTRMQGAGLITCRGDSFYLTTRGAMIVKGYRAIRRLFRHA